MKSQPVSFVLYVLALSLLLPEVHAHNIVANSGFETGDFSGWTRTGNTGATFVAPGAGHSGSFAAVLGPVGSNGFLTQTLTTVPGNLYEFSFWLQNIQGGSSSNFAASLNGVTFFALTNSSSFSYTQFFYSGILINSSSAGLQFDYRHDPSAWVLDDIFVVSRGTAVVPETASTGILLLFASAGLFIARRISGRRNSGRRAQRKRLLGFGVTSLACCLNRFRSECSSR